MVTDVRQEARAWSLRGHQCKGGLRDILHVLWVVVNLIYIILTVLVIFIQDVNLFACFKETLKVWISV